MEKLCPCFINKKAKKSVSTTILKINLPKSIRKTARDAGSSGRINNLTSLLHELKSSRSNPNTRRILLLFSSLFVLFKSFFGFSFSISLSLSLSLDFMPQNEEYKALF